MQQTQTDSLSVAAVGQGYLRSSVHRTLQSSQSLALQTGFRPAGGNTEALELFRPLVVGRSDPAQKQWKNNTQEKPHQVKQSGLEKMRVT